MPYQKPESLTGSKPAKTAVRYTDEEKAAALSLYVTIGPQAASRELGMAPATIVNWAREAGVKTQALEHLAAHTRASAAKWEDRRVELAHKMGDLAEESLDLARVCIAVGIPRDARDAASTMAVAVDKAQLLTGGPTERVGIEERFSEREGEIERARQRAQEVASRAAPPLPTTPVPEPVVPEPVLTAVVITGGGEGEPA